MNTPPAMIINAPSAESASGNFPNTRISLNPGEKIGKKQTKNKEFQTNRKEDVCVDCE